VLTVKQHKVRAAVAQEFGGDRRAEFRRVPERRFAAQQFLFGVIDFHFDLDPRIMRKDMKGREIIRED
jgi:hypothetical protein